MTVKHVVLSAMGPDKPGIVKEFSSVIHKSGGNIEDSRMAILAGDFAIIVLFTASDSQLQAIKKDCAVLEEKLGFQVHFKETEKRVEPAEFQLYEFEATGVDQPGIVHSISAILAELDINVVSLESRLGQAAFHGTLMFTVRAKISVSTPSILQSFRDKLEQVCDRLDLTYDLSPAANS